MFEVPIHSVCEQINEAFSKRDLARVDSLLWPALDQCPELPQLWFYAGNLSFQTNKVALAARCFEHAVDLDENPLVLSNLGASYRRLNDQENGLAVLKECIERNPDYEPALVNYGAMYVNEGCPREGIPALEKACELGRAKGKLETGAEWNLGLLYLEAGRFAEGFDIYRRGFGSERLVRTYAYGDVAEPARLEPEDHVRAVQSDGNHSRPTLLIWGEQGIGDEIMFASILNDAIEHYEIIFECHPRLERLHRNSTWARKLAEQGRPVRLYPTRKDTHIAWPVTDKVTADYKCPIGDLASFYRRTAESFTEAWAKHGPTYAYRVDERDEYRAHLEGLAQGRPIVGLATRGGVLTTARAYRTIRVGEIERLMEATNCLFVGVDYDDMTPVVYHIHEKYGPTRYLWPTAVAQHWDYEHMAALLAATDLNVLVCQSAAHLSAHIGQKTLVLTPKRCAWRYADLGNDSWYWAPSPDVKLIRQTDAESWDEPLGRVAKEINQLWKWPT